ncbi:phage major capsid protein, partial [Niveibacterium sp.]|uniref:phage major capsid protein n=1 Tax=Niveibacterium sp. TaxID=2017444 RepID=UPI0035B09AD7
DGEPSIDVCARRLIEMGATTLTGLTGNIAIPRQTGGAAFYWVGENGAPTESQASFDQVAMSPKTIGLFTDYSRRLMMQSSISIEAFVRADLALGLSVGLDYTGMNGLGSGNEPTGLFNMSGVGAVVGGTNGAAPTWDMMVQMEEAVAVANADVGALAYLTNPKVRSKLKRTQKFSGTNGQEIWLAGRDSRRGIGEVNGYDAYATNNVPSNLTKGTSNGICSAAAFGNWVDFLIAMWGGLDILLDPYSQSTTGARRVVALMDTDINIRRGGSFAVTKDLLTS